MKNKKNSKAKIGKFKIPKVGKLPNLLENLEGLEKSFKLVLNLLSIFMNTYHVLQKYQKLNKDK